MRKTVCFTGPRPKRLCGYYRESYQDLLIYLQKIIEDLYLSCYKEFITGGAQGFDQLAFQAINAVKKKNPSWDISNILAIPFHGQELRWKETGIFGQKEYREMLTAADKIVYVSDLYKNQNPYFLLFKRNEYMIDSSDLVVALYPDENWENAKSGGTENAMKYAKKKGIPLRQIIYHTNEKENRIVVEKTTKISL